MPVPPSPTSWDQPTADRFLVTCTATMRLLDALALEQRGLDALARDQWRGPTRTLFDELVTRRTRALDEARAALGCAHSLVERASADAPAVQLRAALLDMPFVPGLS